MSVLFSSIVKGCFAGVLTLILASPVAGAQLFTLSSITGWWDYDSAAIREVDPATGATISFRWIILPPGTYGAYTTGMAVQPTTGEFFALVESAPSPTGPICQHKLAKIDPATGAATIIGNTGACFASLAFHGNGTLYGVTNSEGAVPPSLFTLDTTSATPTFLISFDTVGVSSGADFGGSGLAFNPSDGLLYRSGRVDVSDQVLQAINPNTLAVTDIPLSGSPTDEIIALTHSFGNTLLGADVGNRLFSITTEGVRTLTGPMDHLARGLVFATTAPVDFQEVLTASPGQGSVLAAGVETKGSMRGPAFQIFNPSGTLQTGQFVLNRDFRVNVQFALGNFDADGADEVLVGGRETSGLARGPAYQLFDTDGTFKFTRFVLNPDFTNISFSSLNVGSNGVLACGQEISGLRRGPAYQAFDSSGNPVRTQFVLNADFTADNSCLGSNLDGAAGDEVIVGGREVSGLTRGPAFQIFGSDGSLRLTQFVLNPNFSETKFTVLDVGRSKDVVVYGRETSGASRGPAFQIFDSNGNFVLTRFVLNPNFTDFQVFGANATNAISGEEIVTGGTERGGLARGPAIQVWDKSGNHLFTRFVLNPDFTEVKFTKIDINNDGVDEILVVGRETKGLARGPAFQLFDGNGTLVTQFVLNGDFTNVKAFAVDQNGDGNKEIGVGGVETRGLLRGPAYQIFESNGTLVQTQFVLNADF